MGVWLLGGIEEGDSFGHNLVVTQDYLGSMTC